MLVVLDDLRLDVLALQASPSSPSGQGHGSTARLPCFAPWHSSLPAKRTEFERPFASHRANGMLFLQLRSALPLRLSKNWLWVQLIVTLPITGTMPWYPPRDTQSRGPSLLLTSVHVEQYRKCASTHVSYSFLNSGCKTTIFWVIHRYAKCSSLRNKNRAVRSSVFCPISLGGLAALSRLISGYDLET